MSDDIVPIKTAPSVQPAVQRTVFALRRDALQAEPGALLGQEDELTARYAISRPTLRQAAALVAQEQLVRIRRGVGGGYFAHRPDFSGVAHMAAILLQVEGVRLDEMLTAIETIRLEIVTLASHASEEALGALAAFLDADEALSPEDYSFRRFLRAERQQNELLGRASGNQVLHLFMQILLELVATLRPDDDVLFGKQERYLEWRLQRNRMIRAVLARDPEIATIEARRGADKIRRWLHEDRAASAARAL